MIVIASTKPYAEKMLIDAFQQYAPVGSYCLAGDIQSKDATTAACWFPDFDQLNQLPHLKLIHSMGAGIEHLDLTKIQPSHQICRIVDKDHKFGMLSYLKWGVLYYQRYFDQYLQQQKKCLWKQFPQLTQSDIQIGVMGLGELGAFVAEKLANEGYQVSGWSRSKKILSEVQCFCGMDEFDNFLKQSQILINLLPLTKETCRILSKETFVKLPQGAAIINSGRGAHLHIQDLIDSIKSKHIRGAILDVFEHEPLDHTSPLWTIPEIVITPHIASHAPLETVVKQIVENDQRIKQGLPLLNCVDITRGY
ncbi:glyoxylate/hydroxypyruvate reductase A [Acinetobacter baumannii]|uniref:2-hydroxyacid dehydrogenase n=1 Tax=Acinetobacter baumannii TaxID=470 RepID=UPI000571D444|nr:glyoxylate/hydroxypyruvate reductase A [Acinetobacter baumannii]EHF3481035.1 glyoxylate/hydroxypyruvate reductase A [Acinetobacter baumannii]EHU3427523.1 glyoxylate/hydroxypyruvate reductase A [Acinetobacter baumannii]EJB8376916.1 glyoxylate/hydroxypyruvate reductase A [Acinetobacter baumannii]EJB8458680.1 glyoxylate/hydroxypyruvate reductase A [Acinetobacter baumannii]MDC4272729.1 glyoxylate/hydroxypyruvate reductase A [Acinetobacter baumannii]